MRNWFNRNLMTTYALPFYLITLLLCAPLYATDDTAKSDDNDLIKKLISLLEENFKKVSYVL